MVLVSEVCRRPFMGVRIKQQLRNLSVVRMVVLVTGLDLLPRTEGSSLVVAHRCCCSEVLYQRSLSTTRHHYPKNRVLIYY